MGSIIPYITQPTRVLNTAQLGCIILQQKKHSRHFFGWQKKRIKSLFESGPSFLFNRACAGYLSLDELCLCRNLQPTVLPNGACLSLVICTKLSKMVPQILYQRTTSHSTCKQTSKQGKWLKFAHIFKGSYRLCTKVSDSAFCAIWMAVLRTKHSKFIDSNGLAWLQKPPRNTFWAVTNAEWCIWHN